MYCRSFCSFVTLCIVIVTTAIATTIIRRGANFCYNDSEGCGPNTDAWAPLCRTGTHQSPIDLPDELTPLGLIPLNIHAYRGNLFRMQNNGHSVQIDFGSEGPSSEPLAFPDPSDVAGEVQQLLSYKFAGGHFHWGAPDDTGGSEHCIGGKCSAMELHLVHYRAIYSTIGEAIESEDENALAVLGILIDADELSDPEDALTPIVRNLESVGNPDHGNWKTVNEPLSLISLLEAGGPYAYAYKGSLTTPGCNEQVNWFVLKGQAKVSQETVASIASGVMDSHGTRLAENHRPLQDTNEREIHLAKIFELQKANTKTQLEIGIQL